MSEILIVYYSRKGENYCAGLIKKLEKGNTETAAEFIKKAVGGELFEIDTVKPYSENYRECTKEAKDEYISGARPEIKAFADNLNSFDTIFVCYPNWCGTMPMAMFTFLEHYDLSGKRIIPLCTNEGSGMGRSEQDLTEICKGAQVMSGLEIKGCHVNESEKKVAEWAKNSVKAVQ